jgi:hypothetical protein
VSESESCLHWGVSDWQDQVALIRLFQEARNQRNSFFERLAILDGGTVALVITAVLGPMHGTVRYKLLLEAGLTCLVLAMLSLLSRNLFATDFEFHIVGEMASHQRFQTSEMRERASSLSKGERYSRIVGTTLSALGVLLLLTEVWLVL